MKKLSNSFADFYVQAHFPDLPSLVVPALLEDLSDLLRELLKLGDDQLVAEDLGQHHKVVLAKAAISISNITQATCSQLSIKINV